MELMMTVFWAVSSPVMRRGVTTTSWNQNDNPWNGDMQITHQRKSSKCSHQQVMCTVFGENKGMILLDFLEPRQTINSDHYITALIKPKAKISRVRP
jgi:hypothetical protein